MKKFLGIAMALVVISGSSYAQQQRDANPDGRMRSRGMMNQDKMFDELNLSAAQKEQMKAIHEKYRPQMQTLRENTTLSPDDKRTQMKDIRDKQLAEINALLTPEQRTKWEAARQQRMNNANGAVDSKSKGEWKDDKGNKGEWKTKDGKTKGEWKGAKGDNGEFKKEGGNNYKELGLTDAQQAQMKTALADRQAKMKALKENNSLTKEQKKEQLKTIQAEFKTQQQNILTPEQQQKWNNKKGSK